MDRLVVTASNYVVASLVSLVMLLLGDSLGSPLEWPGAFVDGLPGVLEGGSFGGDGSAGWAVVLGVPTGVVYFLGFILLQRAVRESGVSLAGSFSKLGVLVPMSLAVLLWREIPAPVQWVGIALALAAILLANLDLRRGRRLLEGLRPVLILLFLTVGVAEFSNKLYQRYGLLEVKSLFLLVVFGTALVTAWWRVLACRRRPAWRDVSTGLVVGVPNYFASHFLILSLSRLDAAVVFPVYSALTIVVISLAGRLVFGERLRGRERASVIMTVVALVLVNLE